VSRIGYVCNRYPAVANNYILDEVLALRELGLDVEVISVRRPRPGDMLARVDYAEHARTHYLVPPGLWELCSAHLRALLTRPIQYLSTLLLAWRLSAPGFRAHLWQLLYFAEAVMVWQHCKRRDVRHLHAHHAFVASDDALLAAHLGRWSWSLSMHGPTEFYDVRGTRLAEKVAHADAVVCISDFCRSQLMGLTEPSRWNKLHVVRCGVRVERFARSAARDGTGAGPVGVLNVARHVPVKGHITLLEALVRVLERGLPVTLTLIGDGPERTTLERRVHELALEQHVRILGAVGQDDIREQYERADIFCLPSSAEGLPIVLMEAMAMELPVVASQVMGVSELVEHDVSGLLVTPARPDLLADALERLASDPALRASMGAAGRKKVLAAHDVRRSARSLSEIYRGLGVGLVEPEPQGQQL
jgi:colanic acid/amylovoran biosynthesis glycosyltransferase